WLVDGARRWYDNAKVMPAAPTRVVDDTREWRSRSDQVLAFVIDQLEFAPNVAILAQEMFETFTDWLEGRNQSKWSETTFHERFDAHRELSDNGVEHRKRVRTSGLHLSRKRGLFS